MREAESIEESQKSLRVAHLVPALFAKDGRIIGGAERYALELARHMAERVPTTLISFGETAQRRQLGKLQICILNNAWYVRGQRFNPLSWSIFPELKRTNVIHCHQQHILSSSLTALFAKCTRRRVFVSDLGGGGFDISAYISTDRWYDGHLHISEYSRTIYGHKNKSFAHVIMGGVDVEKFSPDASLKRSKTILYVGRLLPHKGIDVLIRAVTPDMPLEIIGQPYNEEYYRLLHELAIGKNVTFRHDCSDEQLVTAYRQSLCVVLPSVYRDVYGNLTKVPELLGQTLLEGMACGAPAICSNVASMPEVVRDGVTGFTVPPNDAEALRERLIWLGEHPAEAETMGCAARQHILENFTWQTIVERCLEIYMDSSVQNC